MTEAINALDISPNNDFATLTNKYEEFLHKVRANKPIWASDDWVTKLVTTPDFDRLTAKLARVYTDESGGYLN